ncbi:MAG: hypothetical protein Q9160_001895 [Pyrenula sp. 1 TL-2023]
MARPRTSQRKLLRPGAERRGRKVAFREVPDESRNVSQNASTLFPHPTNGQYGEETLPHDVGTTTKLEELIQMLRDMYTRDALSSRAPDDVITTQQPGVARAPNDHDILLGNSKPVSHGQGRVFEAPSQSSGGRKQMAMPARTIGKSRLARDVTAERSSTRTSSSNLRVPSFTNLRSRKFEKKPSYSTIDDIVSRYLHFVPDDSSQARPTLKSGAHEPSNETTNTMKRYREMESYVLSSHISGNPFSNQSLPLNATDHNQEVLRSTATAFIRGITRPPSPSLKDNQCPTHWHNPGEVSPQTGRLRNGVAGSGPHDPYTPLDQADQGRDHGAEASQRFLRARRDRADAWNKLEGGGKRREMGRAPCGDSGRNGRDKWKWKLSVVGRNSQRWASLKANGRENRKDSNEDGMIGTRAVSYQNGRVRDLLTSEQFSKHEAEGRSQTAPANRLQSIDRKHILRKSRTDQILVSQGRDPLFSKTLRRPKKLQKKRRPGPPKLPSRKSNFEPIRGKSRLSADPWSRRTDGSLRRKTRSIIMIDAYIGMLVSKCWRRRRRKRENGNNRKNHSSGVDRVMRQRKEASDSKPVVNVRENPSVSPEESWI